MSKSAPNANSRILLTDSPELIVKKIRGAVTDSSRTLSWDPEGRRGVGNLLRILEACEESGAEQETDEEQRMTQFTERLVQSGVSSHAELKGLVADRVVEKLRPIREEYLKIRADEGYLSEIAREGRERARELAGRTMTEVRRKVGLDAI
jgi:tryptophanyl-tRNA synthetase